MSENLLEFLKVLTIVVTWSSLILAMRHYMLSLEDSSEEEDKLPKTETISVKLNGVSVKSPKITNEVTSKDLNSSASRKN